MGLGLGLGLITELLASLPAGTGVPLEVVLGDDALHLARVRVELRVRVKGEL